jgi:hypothetical protein
VSEVNDQQPFQTLHNNINEMVQISVDVDSTSESLHHKQLLNNIICNNVWINQPSESKELLVEQILEHLFGRNC